MNDLLIPNRYLTPKWQAYVTPSDKGFSFPNGISCRSLWELKQALLSLPEDLILHHLDNRNDFADWVENVVGDFDLAEEMRKYQHRWGLIVAMERQLMRSVSLPDYVAKRWLSKAYAPFTFVSGENVSSLEELASVLLKVSDDVVSFHSERNPNDISVWVADVIGDYELADMLEDASSRSQMQRFVEDHIAELKEAAETD